MSKKVLQAASSIREEITWFLSRLISVPSLCGREGEAIGVVKKQMEELGYDDVRVDGFGNLLGRMGSGKRLVVLDGHVDTVDVGNPDNWEVEPFKGLVRDGVVYGRGAADQKGGLAAALYAAKLLKEMGLPEEVTLLVVASVLEEDAEGLCWDYILLEEGLRPDAVVLTEPTGLGICTGQRGRMEMKVTASGVSSHGAAPDRGENAVYKMAPILQEVEQLHRRLESDSPLGKGSVTVTDIRSTAPSLCAVADSCTIHLDRRLTEGETRETALAQVRRLPSVRSCGAKVWVPKYQTRTYTGLQYPCEAYYPAWLMPRDHPLVRDAAGAYREELGTEPSVGVWQFSTNGVSTKGVHDIPTIGFGPGLEEHAHTPRDQVNVDDLIQAAAFYVAFVRRLGRTA